MQRRFCQMPVPHPRKPDALLLHLFLVCQEDFFVRPIGDDAAGCIEQHEPFGECQHMIDFVFHNDDRFVLADILQDLPDRFRSFRIQHGGGLIQKEHFRIQHQYRGDRQPLLHPSGKAFDGDMAVRQFQTHLPERKVYFGSHLFARNRQIFEHKSEFFIDIGHAELAVRVLKNIAPGSRRHELFGLHRHFDRLRNQPAQHLQQRGFAAAGWPQKQHFFAFSDRKGKVPEQQLGIAGKFQFQFLHIRLPLHFRHPP